MCTKVHVLKPPYVPNKCRALWSDYTTLAKTRLLDLKVSSCNNISIMLGYFIRLCIMYWLQLKAALAMDSGYYVLMVGESERY